jgi:Protein of unknown function (DUF4054)
MAITKTDVLNVAPELTAISDPQWAALIGYAYAQMDPDIWATWLDMGAAYLVAHLATLTRRHGTGPVQSESVGQVSRSYQAFPLTAGALESTAYGNEYLRLLNMLGDARFPVVG